MSYNLSDCKVLIIGAGPMAVDYAKVLGALKVHFDVVGRGENSSAGFAAKTGKMPFTGGVEFFLQNHTIQGYTHVIIATGLENLAHNATLIINAGIKKVLVEKPGGINLGEIEKLKIAAQTNNVEAFIAYNRRFYSSVAKAKEIIEADGGITSFHFDFTEWGHVIEPLVKAPGVKEAWLLGNSTHVIDLAFYLGGSPKELSSYTAGKLPWHNKSIYSGAGITESGALFNYGANWESAGRWGIELMTRAHKIILRPMEQLFIQKKGSIEINQVQLEDEIDKKYKPGLYKQTEAFLTNDFSLLPTIDEQYRKVKDFYLKIMGE